MELRPAFGSVLREARKAKGLSQEALAAEAGVDRTHLSDLERGLYNVSITTAYLLAMALEVAPELLFERTSERTTMVDGRPFIRHRGKS